MTEFLFSPRSEDSLVQDTRLAFEGTLFQVALVEFGRGCLCFPLYIIILSIIYVLFIILLFIPMLLFFKSVLKAEL